MALYNIAVDASGHPVLAQGEVIIDYQPFVVFCIESGGGYPGYGGCYRGPGVVYLTSTRLAFVRDGARAGIDGPGFFAYSISYRLIQKELHKDPFFGSPFISAVFAASGRESNIQGQFAEMKIEFKKGGDVPFFRKLSALLQSVRTSGIPTLDSKELSVVPSGGSSVVGGPPPMLSAPSHGAAAVSLAPPFGPMLPAAAPAPATVAPGGIFVAQVAAPYVPATYAPGMYTPSPYALQPGPSNPLAPYVMPPSYVPASAPPPMYSGAPPAPASASAPAAGAAGAAAVATPYGLQSK